MKYDRRGLFGAVLQAGEADVFVSRSGVAEAIHDFDPRRGRHIRMLCVYPAQDDLEHLRVNFHMRSKARD